MHVLEYQLKKYGDVCLIQHVRSKELRVMQLSQFKEVLRLFKVLQPNQVKENLLKRLRQLSYRQQLIISLYKYEKLEVEEIANILHDTKENIVNEYLQSLQALRKIN